MKLAQHKDSTQVQLYTSTRRGVTFAKVQPGQFYVCSNGTEITTVLGSCIAACIYDLKAGVGGLNHFMLPQDLNADYHDGTVTPQPSSRFGENAMANMLKQLMLAGAQRKNLQAKVFGGAKVLDISSNIGQLNIAFADSYFKRENIPVIASDVGGNLPRKLIFEPRTGKVHVNRLRNAYFEHVASKERHYLNRLSKTIRSTLGSNRDD
ncbi:UNVERIFIED_CONTAM: hypothetical protein GTU68_014826 [Idotea baltica]|nr:hypothetical protein [Idotea baltica]